MIDLFSSIPVRSNDISGNFLHAQVQIHAKDLFTGFFSVRGNDGSETILLFSQGGLTGVYQNAGSFWVYVPKLEWDDVIAASGGDWRVAAIPAEGLRVLRLFLESKLGDAKIISSTPANGLPAHIESWERSGSAGLMLAVQEDASLLMLYPSGETNPADGLLLSEARAQAGSVVANQIKAWGERPCQVMLCTYEEKSEAWKEYDLRISFSSFVQTVLHRYEELAGRFLVTDLGEQVNEEIRDWGMALSLYGSKLSNRQFFETAERAGKAYVDVFKMVDKQMEVVIGEKMTTGIFEDALMQLGSNSRVLVKEYVLSQLGGEAA